MSEAGVGSEAVDPLRPRARPTVWPGRRPVPGLVAPGPPGSTRSRMPPLATSSDAHLRWSVGVVATVRRSLYLISGEQCDPLNLLGGKGVVSFRSPNPPWDF